MVPIVRDLGTDKAFDAEQIDFNPRRDRAAGALIQTGECPLHNCGRRPGGAHWLHTARSDSHEVVLANALGIDSAWIDRQGDKPLPGGVPKLRVPLPDRARRRVGPLSSYGRFTSKCAIIPAALTTSHTCSSPTFTGSA